MNTPATAVCAECGAALAGDQRYCLECGARHGERSPALTRILAGLSSSAWTFAGTQRSAAALPTIPAQHGVASRTAAPRPRRRPSPRISWGGLGALPGPRTAAVLTLAMLGFGTLAGAAASNPTASLAALRRGPLTLLVPAQAPRPTASVPATPSIAANATPEVPASSPQTPVAEPSESSTATNGTRGKSAPSAGSEGSGKASPTATSKLPPIKHVFMIVLSDEPYALTFGPESPAPYIAHTLEHRGELLPRVYAVAHEGLADEVALVSGLGPTPQTEADCPTFSDILPSIPDSAGQYTGDTGCIYPRAAETIGSQLEAKHLSWRVYAEALGETGSTSHPVACWHPEFEAADPSAQTPAGERFATFLDPFTYFDGVLHSPSCAHDDVGLEALYGDLKNPASTPAFSYIVPDLCDDGRPTPCVPGPGGGLPAAEGFLRRVVPEILAAPAYRKDGLLIITTDQAPATGEYGDSSSCCEQPRFPAPELAPAGATGPTGPTGATGATGPTGVAGPTGAAATAPGQSAVALPPTGGGQVGALLLSPYVKAGTSNQEPANDFTLLHTIEEIFGVPHLGYAGAKGVGSLEAEVFSGSAGS